MRYLLYFALGPWPGQWAIFSFIVGIWFLFFRRLVMPIHGFKLKKISGTLILISTLISLVWTVQLGNTTISSEHLQKLRQLEKNIPKEQSVLAHYSIEKLTEADFFLLKRKIKRATHLHFQRHKIQGPFGG